MNKFAFRKFSRIFDKFSKMPHSFILKLMQAKNLIALALLCMLVSACFPPKKYGTLTGRIQIDGSSTVYPITEAVSEEYRKSQSEVKVTVGISGTGGGFKKFIRNEIDINDASKRISHTQDSACHANGINFLEIQIAYDGLVVVVNPENSWCKSITVEELKRMWEPGAQEKIMRWNQIRPEWPNEEIHLFGAGTESGTYEYFTEAITGKAKSSRGDYTASEDDNVLVQGISMDKYALGFFGMAYFEENADKLKAVPVDDGKPENGDGPILPTQQTVREKTYAPLGRPLFIYLNSKSAVRPEVVNFTEFYLKTAPELVREIGFVPMQPAEYEEQKQKFAAFLKQHGVNSAVTK